MVYARGSFTSTSYLFLVLPWASQLPIQDHVLYMTSLGKVQWQNKLDKV